MWSLCSCIPSNKWSSQTTEWRGADWQPSRSRPSFSTQPPLWPSNYRDLLLQEGPIITSSNPESAVRRLVWVLQNMLRATQEGQAKVAVERGPSEAERVGSQHCLWTSFVRGTTASPSHVLFNGFPSFSPSFPQIYSSKYLTVVCTHYISSTEDECGDDSSKETATVRIRDKTISSNSQNRYSF